MSLSSKMYHSVLVCGSACVLAILNAPAMAEVGESVEQIVGRIKAYEALFDHAHIQYELLRTSKRDGKWELGAAQRVVDLKVRAPHMRHEYRATDTCCEPEMTRVTDGELSRYWRVGGPGGGHGGISPFDSTEKASFGLQRFQRHANLQNIDPNEIAITEDTPTHVSLKITSKPSQYALLRYERFGEYLRTLNYEPHYIDPETGNDKTLTVLRFTYPEWTEATLEDAGPETVQQILETHDSLVHLNVTSVNFSPKFDDSEFELNFPDGALVVDRRSGKQERYYFSQERHDAGLPQKILKPKS